MMRAEDVVEVLGRLETAGVAVWLDGGWGVDALLGAQSRPHDDLDLVVELAQVDRARLALEGGAFRVLVDELPKRLVMRDAGDRRVDFHAVTFDGEGGGLQRVDDGQVFRYPPQGFAGRGRVDGRAVRCLTAEVQMLCHLGYDPDAGDLHDVRLLHERFGTPLPEVYRLMR